LELFINGVGLISPQRTSFNEHFLNNISEPEGEYFRSVEPVYNEYLNPNIYRRLSRILKTNLISAKLCLQDGGIDKPDAIIVGTGLGCIADTESFLFELLEKKEKLLSPTQFMQSTHNSISSQIALSLNCYGYNVTFSHRSFSFENALLDGYLLLKENQMFNVLVGGTDEITERLYTIKKNIGAVKYSHNKRIIIPGEGSAFYLLSYKECEKSYACVKGISTYHRLKYEKLIIEDLAISVLEQAGIKPDEIDLLILGNTEHARFDNIYSFIADKMFSGKDIIPYKLLCGDYYTASSFALALATNIIKYQRIPESLKSFSDCTVISNILIYNSEKEIDNSMIVVSKC
jgi:3-oxoacyl-[acyl-carrier-protein] synthase II